MFMDHDFTFDLTMTIVVPKVCRMLKQGKELRQSNCTNISEDINIQRVVGLPALRCLSSLGFSKKYM